MLYVGLDLSRKRLDYHVSLADGGSLAMIVLSSAFGRRLSSVKPRIAVEEVPGRPSV